MTISRLIFPGIRNVSNKSCKQTQNTHCILSDFSENCAVYETMSKNLVKREGPQMTSQNGAYALHSG